jgi:chromosome segregation ATPase
MDGCLELQSAPPSPRSASREGSDEELDRLRRQMDELRNEIGELTRAQQEAADTIAALQAAGRKCEATGRRRCTGTRIRRRWI